MHLEERGRPPLGNYAAALRAELREVELELLATAPGLARGGSTWLHEQGTAPNVNARLFAVVVAGAAGGKPLDGLPVSVLSSLWWAGVEAMELARDQSTEIRGVTNAAMMPIHYVMSLDIPVHRRAAWTDDLIRSTIPVIDQHTRDTADATDETVADGSNGRTSARGAAYARDAVMVVRALGLGSSLLKAWYEFGRLYGLLADLAAANSPPSRGNDVPALLFAHAFATSGAHCRHELARLRREAIDDARARTTLAELVRSPDCVRSYTRDLAELRRRAIASLTALCANNPFTANLRSDVEVWSRLAHVPPREVVGSA